MKDLHIKLDDYHEIILIELCKYCGCKQTDLIETLLAIAHTSAKIQIYLSDKYPDKLPKDLNPTDGYYLMHITDIFDHLYPTPEEL